MGFAYPYLTLLFWAVPLLIALFIFAGKVRAKKLNTFVDSGLSMSLVQSATSARRRFRSILIVILLALFIFAIAGLQIGTKMNNIKRKGVDIFIAVDCSKSMLAEDVVPNRLAKAKREMSDLISKLDGDRVGVVAFAGAAFLQCPLTLDYDAAKMIVDLIDTDLIPKPGTNISQAIKIATDSFVKAEKKYKAIIILTDGEDHEGSLESAIESAKNEGARIYAIGFGKPSGDPVPVRDANGVVTGYLKDKSGNTVMSRMDERTLQNIALQTGGKYFRSSDEEIEIDRIYEDISGMEKKELQDRLFSQRENRYQYFLFIGLILLIFEMILPERKRVLTSVAIFLIFFLPAVSNASIDGKIKKANKDYRQQKFDDALEKYRDAQVDRPESSMIHFNIGDALYKTGDYEGAKEEFAKSIAAKEKSIQGNSYYNIGNCLFEQNKFEEAIQYYKKALDVEPKNKDAKYNIELIQSLMKQGINKQNKKQDKNKDQKKDQKQDQQKKDQENKEEGNKKEDKKKQEQNKKEEQGKKDDQQQDAQPQPKEGQMSKEDAQRVLDAFKESEQKASKERKQMVPVFSGKVDKEW